MNTLNMTCITNAASCSNHAAPKNLSGLQRPARSISTAKPYRLAVRTSAQQTEEITTTASTTDIASSTSPSETTDEEARRYLSILPPFFSRTTTCEQLSEGLWALVQPLKPPGQADIRLRMVVARLDDGNLLLCGPIAPTGEVLNILENFGGKVSHVIVPNTSPEHFLYAPALAEAKPLAEAKFWFCPGFFEGKGVPLPGRSLLFRSLLARGQNLTLGVDPLPSELQGQLQTVLFDVPFFLEAAVCLPRHRVLLLADTGICLSADDPEYAALGDFNVKMAEKLGLWGRLGPVTRIVFEKYSKEGKAWVEAVLNECPEWDTIVPAHGSAPVKDGRSAFKNCFDFLF